MKLNNKPDGRQCESRRLLACQAGQAQHVMSWLLRQVSAGVHTLYDLPEPQGHPSPGFFTCCFAGPKPLLPLLLLLLLLAAAAAVTGLLDTN
jgi:hypothetical protein